MTETWKPVVGYEKRYEVSSRGRVRALFKRQGTQRLGWQPLLKAFPGGYWQGGFIYEPDSAKPYLVCQVSGILYSILLEPPFSITDLETCCRWKGTSPDT